MYHCVSSKRFIAFYQILRLLIRWIASQNFENVKLLKKLSMHFGWFKYNASTKFLSQLDVIHEELVIWILQYMWILIYIHFHECNRCATIFCPQFGNILWIKLTRLVTLFPNFWDIKNEFPFHLKSLAVLFNG